MKTTAWKRLTAGLLFVMAMVIPAGCLTLGAPDRVDAYRLGRFATVAYLSQKDKMSEKHVKIVEVVYSNFALLVNTEIVSGSPKDLLMSTIRGELKNEPELMMVANEMIDMYWSRLETNFKISSLVNDKQLDLLQQFNRGIKDALADYKDFGSTE